MVFYLLSMENYFIGGVIGAAIGLTYSFVKKTSLQRPCLCIEDEKGGGGLACT
jgi:hypothetical protein